jgi:site-specific recombinase XerC
VGESGKFSGKGLVRPEALLKRVQSRETAAALARKANYGLARSTQDTYQVAVNHLERCELDTGVCMSLPFDDKKVMEFMGWMENRGLRSRSMATYLSGVRAFHIASGYKDPFLRDPMVKLILKGQENFDRLQDRLEGKAGKLPVTLNVMKLLKKNLVKAAWSELEKRIFWAVAAVAWSGSFRIHELCSRKAAEFDIQTTLLWEDISFGEVELAGERIEAVSMHVKSPKVDRVGAGDKIQVFELGNFMCPVAAMRKWMERSKLKQEEKMPVFRMESGVLMTGAEMNRRLKMLTREVDSLVPGGVIKSHSFRSGVPSEMAKAGQDAEAIQAVGRWKSDAYKAYVKLPVAKRAVMARQIGRKG